MEKNKTRTPIQSQAAVARGTVARDIAQEMGCRRKRVFGLFKKKESNPVLKELSNLDALFKGKFSPDLTYDQTKEKVRSAIKKSADAIQRELDSGRSPREICLGAIVQTVLWDLESGEYHVYRGMLSQIGQSKKSIWTIGMNELVKMGACTPEVRAQRAKELEEAIREAG